MAIGEVFVIVLVVILIILVWYNVYKLTTPSKPRPEVINGVRIIQKSQTTMRPEELDKKIEEYHKRSAEYERLKDKYNNVTPLNPKPRNPGPGPGGAA